jgi:hypothetical protein
MKKSGLADSPFFQSSQVKIEATTPPLADSSAQDSKPEKIKKPKQVSKQTGNRDTTVSRYHATTIPRYHDTTIPQAQIDIVGLVRKAVKEFGKEAATHRFTEIEKKEIADLIYTYKNRGVKTSENEITRIAVNYIVEDYKENGENSVLHKILKALNE